MKADYHITSEMSSFCNDIPCPRLAAFIGEVTQGCFRVAEAFDKTLDFLLTSAAKGDCQFNRRCREWDKCPVAKQVLKRPCRDFFTKPPKTREPNTNKNE